MFCYRDDVNKLNAELVELKNRVAKKIDEARDAGRIIYDDVLFWQQKVEEIEEGNIRRRIHIPVTASRRCIHIPNPVSRFRLGRQAVHKAKSLIDVGKQYFAQEVAYLPPAEVEHHDELLDFQSRNDAYRNIWEALVNDGDYNILGVYGMPGVGKTHLVRRIGKEAKEKKIFDKVALAVVGSDKLDVKYLQDQIASHINCSFETQDSVERRASHLKSCLLNEGKILVILDDVWRKIPLDIIGIPCGEGTSSMGCKILFTSREESVCLSNYCKHPVQIGVLTPIEAWDLFKNCVGTRAIDSLQDESLAKNVCSTCAGLPLLIKSVGHALRFKPQYVWEDAFVQLQKGNFKTLAGVDSQVYACVKMSIDNIPDDAKSCLFLCSLFPDDAEIHIRKLIQLAIGLKLVPDGESRVCAMVDILRSSSLLLDSKEDNTIELHDLIRDIARSIAVEDPKYAFSLVQCGSRLPDSADYSTRKLLCLYLESDDLYFPDDLVCPDLHNLWLQCNKHIQQFSGGFFRMFANLNFLLIQEGSFASLDLQFSLRPLSKLRMLILDDCDMTHICQTNDFFPENLETLCIWNCDLPVPLDFSNQKCLRKVEIYSKNEVLMVPNSVFDLSSVEELQIPGGFQFWDDGSAVPVPIESAREVKLQNTDIDVSSIFNDNSDAFADLKNLYIKECNTMEYLAKISQPVTQHSHQPRTSFTKLTTLEIYDCSAMKYLFSKSVTKCLTQLRNLSIDKCPKMETIVTIEGTVDGDDIINFSELRSMKLIGLPRLTSFCRDSSVQFQSLFDGMVAFPCLEKLHIEDLEDTCSIWAKHIYDDIVSFSKLKSLTVSECNNLKIVIPPAMLPRLQNLESLSIGCCSSVISEVGTYGSNAEVYPLEALRAMDLESLPCLTETKLNSRENSEAKTWYPNLENLRICDCNSLRNVFLSSTARILVHLKKMRVVGCKKMTEIIGVGKLEITANIVFPEMTDLQLSRLPNLTSFWGYQSKEPEKYKVEFPNMVNFKILNCAKLTWTR